MILGFNEYIDELLLEAKSPEEVVRILSYKYPELPESLIKNLVATDPTKKKSYSSWVLSVEKNPRKIKEYLDNGRLAEIFDYFRSNAKEGASLTDKDSIEEAERSLPDSSDVLRKTGDPEADDFDVVFQDSDWIIAVPHSYKASKKLGENTKWCTADAYGNGLYYYNDYTSSGPLWVNFKKGEQEVLKGITYPYKRYQFCFERKAFLDAHDDPFDWEDLDMPESVQKFYEEQGYDLEDLMMSNEARWERYTEQRWDDSRWVIDEVYLMRPWNDDMVWDDNEENPDYELYNSSYDEVDSLYNSQTYDADCIVFRNEEKEFAILREKYATDSYSIVIKQPDSNRRSDDVVIYSNLKNFEILGENGSEYVAIIDLNGELRYITNEGVLNQQKGDREFDVETAKIFQNTNVSNNDDFYLEVVDGGTHALYLADFNDFDLIEIVTSDIPENGKYFVIGEDGKINAKYGSYLPSGESIEGDERYRPVRVLGNQGLILGKNLATQKYNIFNKDDMSEKILDEDIFELCYDLSDTDFNAIIVTLAEEDGWKKFAMVSLSTGKRVSREYNIIQVNSDRTIVLAADEKNGAKFILTGKGDVEVSECYGMERNGRIPVQVYGDDGQRRFRVYNQKTGRFEMEWANKMSTITGYKISEFVLVSNMSGEVFLCNWPENKVIESGLSSKKKPEYLRDVETFELCDRSLSLFVLSFEDGTQNLFYCDSDNWQFLLKARPNSITGVKARNCPDQNIMAFALFDYGNITKLVQINRMFNVQEIIAINTNGHEVRVKNQGATMMFTIDMNEVFTINLNSGEMKVFDVKRDERRYDEIPISQASPEKQHLAVQIFPSFFSKTQSLNERMEKVRKDLHRW